MNYSKINRNDVANGPGVRVSLFVSGCRNHCPGCFNPETWDFANGTPFTEETEQTILNALKPGWITGLSLLGGDPFEPENEKALIPLVMKARETGKTVWCWTGYLMEDLKDRELLKHIDVLVDGPFVLAEKDITLPYCGSRNQRVIPISERAKKEFEKA